MTDSRPSESTDTPTGELIAGVRDGRIELFEQIVRRYQQDVLSVVCAMLYDRSATEDLVQQVFVNVYRSLDTFEMDRDFGPWIRTIARNAVREQLRKSARYAKRLETYANMLETSLIDETSTEESQQRMQASLDRCLDKLPERARTIVQLRYSARRSFDDIAADWKTSAGALRNLLSRTRTKLRECIEEDVARQ